MEIEIREATLDDVDELVRWRIEALRDQYASDSDSVDWEKMSKACNTYYMLSLMDGSHVACFAEFLGEPIGVGGMCIREEVPTISNPSGKCAYLKDIYARPAYHSQGIPAYVVEWLISEARAQEAGDIFLESNEALHEMYRALGFNEVEGLMKLR